MKEISQINAYEQLLNNLFDKGCFLVTGTEAPNVMTIGWGATGCIWGRNIMLVLVRESRYTHEKLAEHSEFSVSTVKEGTLNKELALCGTKSGRDMDKAESSGLNYAPGIKIATPHLKEASKVYECKVVYQQDMSEDAFLDLGIKKSSYPKGDYHTLYFAEILNVFENEDN